MQIIPLQFLDERFMSDIYEHSKGLMSRQLFAIPNERSTLAGEASPSLMTGVGILS